MRRRKPTGKFDRTLSPKARDIGELAFVGADADTIRAIGARLGLYELQVVNLIVKLALAEYRKGGFKALDQAEAPGESPTE